MTVDNTMLHLTSEEIDDFLRDKDYESFGEDDDWIFIPVEGHPLPCDRTKAMIAYLNAMTEYEADEDWSDADIAKVVEEDPEPVQFVWGIHDGEKSVALVRQDSDYFDGSKPVVYGFVIEVEQ